MHFGFVLVVPRFARMQPFVDEDLFCVLNKRESYVYRASSFSIGSFFSFVPLTSSLFNIIHNWILMIFLEIDNI